MGGDYRSYLRDVQGSTDPTDNARKICDVRDGVRLYATLYRATVAAGPVAVGMIRAAGGYERFRVFAPPAERSGRPGPEAGTVLRISDKSWRVFGYDRDHDEGPVLGVASSLAVACDVLVHGEGIAGTAYRVGGDAYWRTSGAFRPVASSLHLMGEFTDAGEERAR